MLPIEFPEQNAVLAKDQPQYQPLPVYIDNAPGHNGQVISVWKLTDEEVELIGRTKKLYLSLMAFGKPPMPVFLCVKRGEVFTVSEDVNEPVVPFAIHHHAEIVVNGLWARLRVLFGKPVKYSAIINVDRECTFLNGTGEYSVPPFLNTKKVDTSTALTPEL